MTLDTPLIPFSIHGVFYEAVSECEVTKVSFSHRNSHLGHIGVMLGGVEFARTYGGGRWCLGCLHGLIGSVNTSSGSHLMGLRWV